MPTAFQAQVVRTEVAGEAAEVAVVAAVAVTVVVAAAAVAADSTTAAVEEEATLVEIGVDLEVVETLAVTGPIMAVTKETMVETRAAASHHQIRAAFQTIKDRGQVLAVTLEQDTSSMVIKVVVETSGIMITTVETIKAVPGEMPAVSLEAAVPLVVIKDHGETITKDISVIIIDEEAHQTEVSDAEDPEVMKPPKVVKSNNFNSNRT